MLPQPPDNLQRVVLHGCAVLLPADTNLTLMLGTRLNGALYFDNLTQRQLELRWRTPTGLLPLHRRDPYKTLDRAVKKLGKKSPIEKIADNAFTITTAKEARLLIADAKRLYELLFPNPLPSFAHELIKDFLTTTPPLAAADLWPWQIYGIRASLPRHARLTASSFLPGISTLTFRHRKLKATLSSHSLADRLLQNRSLIDWAQTTFPFLKKISSPKWTQTATAATLSHPPHALTLEHIPSLNLIRSTYELQK